MLVVSEEHSAVVASSRVLEETSIVGLVLKLTAVFRQRRYKLLSSPDLILCLNDLLMCILAGESRQRCNCAHLDTGNVHGGRCGSASVRYWSCCEPLERVAIVCEEKWAKIVVLAHPNWVKDLVLVVTWVGVYIEIHLSSISNFIKALIKICCLNLFLTV